MVRRGSVPSQVIRARTSPPPLRGLNRRAATAAGPRSMCSAVNPALGVQDLSVTRPASHAATSVPPGVVRARTTAVPGVGVAGVGGAGREEAGPADAAASSLSTSLALYGASDVPKMPCRIEPTAPVATAVAAATVSSHAPPARTHRRIVAVAML